MIVKWRADFAVVWLALLFGWDLSGQVSRGTILGTVVDQPGNRVPKARVTVRHTATNFDRSANTNELGDYELVGLPVGQYDIEVEAAGFNRESRTNIDLSVQSRLRLDFSLKVGSVTETIKVEG